MTPSLAATLAFGAAACDPGAPPGGGRERQACEKKVMVIVDDVPGGAAPLALALGAAGFEVTTSAASSSEYRGAPSLAGFGAVVLLAGGLLRTPPADMPAEGQLAIADFVAAGHGLVLSEWAAFHVAAQRWQTLAPLALLGRGEAHTGQVTYEVEPAFAAHPIWAGLPPSFTFGSTSNVGALLPGPGVSRVARSPQAGDAVALRDSPQGRVVHLSHAGTYVIHGWSNVNLQRLVANAVRWAAVCR